MSSLHHHFEFYTKIVKLSDAAALAIGNKHADQADHVLVTVQ